MLLLIGGCWPVFRAVRQANLNRQLITAIKQSDPQHSRAEDVIACLENGADPNAVDQPYEATFSWSHLLALIGLRKTHVFLPQTALLLAVEGEMHDTVDCMTHTVDNDIVKALLQYGADVKRKDRYGRTPLVAAFSPIPYALCPHQAASH
jgi:hypothetical protein